MLKLQGNQEQKKKISILIEFQIGLTNLIKISVAPSIAAIDTQSKEAHMSLCKILLNLIIERVNGNSTAFILE